MYQCSPKEFKSQHELANTAFIFISFRKLTNQRA